MRIKRRRALLALGPAVAVATVTAALVVAPWASAAHVTPTVVDGNPSCATQAPGTTEFKVEPVTSGSHSDGTLTVALTVSGKSFDWSANRLVDVVIVKGGPKANVYDYRPDGSSGDTGLKAPGTAGLSHISFCYDPNKQPPSTTTTETKPTETTTTTETKPTETTTTTTTPPPSGRCTGFAYDLRLDVAGIATGFVGPISSTEPDQFPDRDTFSDISVVFPLTGATEPIVTATTLDAENSGNPQEGCTTRVTYENVTVNLNNITPTQGIPVTLNAKVLETVTTAKQGEEPSSRVTIIGGSLCVQDQCASLPEDQVPPNSGIPEQCFENPDGTGKLCVTLLLHETELIPGGIAANAVRLKVELVTPLPETSSQIVDLKLAHAEADVHDE